MVGIVECHSEYAYAEKPIALTWQGERLEVIEVLATWHTPEAECFRVRTSDEQVFELSYSEASDEWQIHQP